MSFGVYIRGITGVTLELRAARPLTVDRVRNQVIYNLNTLEGREADTKEKYWQARFTIISTELVTSINSFGGMLLVYTVQNDRPDRVIYSTVEIPDVESLKKHQAIQRLVLEQIQEQVCAHVKNKGWAIND